MQFDSGADLVTALPTTATLHARHKHVRRQLLGLTAAVQQVQRWHCNRPSRESHCAVVAILTAMPNAEVAFTVTPRLQQALQHLLDSKSRLTADQRAQVDALPAAKSPSITLTQARLLSSLLLTLHASDSTTSTLATVPSRLYELLDGSSLYTAAASTRRRDPAFLAFLERQRIKQSQREYLSLVHDLPGNTELARAVHATSIATTPTDASDYSGGFGKSIGREMGEGINILTLMVTGFVVFYYGASMVWQHSKLAPVVGGLVGLVGALLLEVTLLMLRERRGEEMQSKRRQELRLKDEQRVAAKRIRDKEAAMQRHMEEMAQQQQTQAAEGEEAAVAAAPVESSPRAEDDGTGVSAATSLRKRKGK